jgi:hypothetical protein
MINSLFTKTINICIILASLLVFVVPVVAYTDIANAQGLTLPSEQTPEEFQQACVDEESCVKQNPILQWINFFINLFSVVIIIGSAIMIAVAGVQYTTSRDNPQAVQAAKQKIWNVLIGLLAFFFLYAFVQWIIPGGVF